MDFMEIKLFQSYNEYVESLQLNSAKDVCISHFFTRLVILAITMVFIYIFNWWFYDTINTLTYYISLSGWLLAGSFAVDHFALTYRMEKIINKQ